MKLRLLFIIILLNCFLGLNAQKKQSVSVLFVGGSPDIELMGLDDKPDSVTIAKSTQTRMTSFDKFLKKNFKKYKVIDAADYTVDMSDLYDVTIFDHTPNPISPRILEYSPDGKLLKYERAQYLPLDFNRPVLTIASMGELIGIRVGSKNDWYCLCLEDKAHNWNGDHPIFKGPLKVKLNIKMEATPSLAYDYAKMDGVTLPDSTLMFTMQTVNYTNNPGYKIGMVSRPEGYLDSPETEVISSGTCAKSIDAIAIGRHANYFHWGFSASPDYMTDEAKALFVNSIVYISQFAGQHPIARKFDPVAVKDDLKGYKYLVTREAWEDYNASNAEFNRQVAEFKKAAQERQDKGEELSGTEKLYLNFPEQKLITFSDYLKQRVPELYHFFGTDATEYARYYDRNRDYFYCKPGEYTLDIDEEARYIGIANNDIRILDKAISMLENGEDVEIAKTVLERYTLCRFATPAQWRDWYETYKDKLFFTESGGWLFLINTFEDVPGNNYQVRLDEQEREYLLKKAAINNPLQSDRRGPQTDPANPVFLEAELVEHGDGTIAVLISQYIHVGHYIYAEVADEDPFIETKAELYLPENAKQVDFITPAFIGLPGSKTTIYRDKGDYIYKIEGLEHGDQVKIKFTYQCCNDKTCYAPETKEFTLTVK